MNIQALINQRVSQALCAAGVSSEFSAAVRQSAKPQFGHYQANGIMAAAKKMGQNPRQLAQTVIDHLDLDQIAEKVEIAGPGFINIFLSPQFLHQHAQAALQSDRLGIARSEQPQTVVVDYSAPNVAKEMHVGHLRSTIIGDAVVRTLSYLGHQVIRANHIGDWGTQFGMLIANLEDAQLAADSDKIALADLEAFYRQSKQRYDEDESFAQRARQYVVKLQAGDATCLQMWRQLVDTTMLQNQAAYDRLNVSLTMDDVMGESLYNPMLADIVADLQQKGIAVEDQGAKVVFLDAFKNKEGEAMGVIVQKSDGGFLYSTTDIACAKYRCETLKADRVLYFIDSRQHQHLQQVWQIAQQAGYLNDHISLEHLAFGMMLGKDGRPFKTRSGGTVKLADLLDEAQERALQLIEQKNPELTASQQSTIAQTVGMAAVKYADLSKNRTTDYVFDWDSMLSFEGNTAPYLQYAYTRIVSLFSKTAHTIETMDAAIVCQHEKEAELVVKLLQFAEAIDAVAKEGSPHLLCGYLFELASLFSSFYEACPILNQEDHALKQSRLALAALTARTLQSGLDLLGINTLTQM